MLLGHQVPAGVGFSTVLADMDFETYSEAGFIWDDVTKSYKAPKGATKKGIFAVGAVVYSEHPSAEVLSLSYDLKDGLGPRLWLPCMPPPQELFDFIKAGGLIEAVNRGFEFWIWKNICNARMGWPELPFYQLVDAAAKFRAHAWPGGLEAAGKASRAPLQKMSEGKRLITKFCCPRKPTRKNPNHRIKLEEDHKDAQLFYDYNICDIQSEAAVSLLCPDLSPSETEFELCTMAANVRGIGLDMETIHAGAAILDQALIKYDSELEILTTHVATVPVYVEDGCGGYRLHPDGLTEQRTLSVKKASEVKKLTAWLATRGVYTNSLDAEAVETLLENPTLPPDARRALEIRQLVGSAGVKKLYAMQRMSSKAGRAHDLIVYHAARTGRDGGRDIQPQNLVKAGPKLTWCGQCEKPHRVDTWSCPWCGSLCGGKQKGWSWHAVEHAVEVIRTGSLDEVERVFGDALLTLSGCIRGQFVPAPNYDFICSDYSSIEAVVTAVLAGEQWRIEAFNRKEDIYLRSASRITGIPYEEYIAYKEKHREHHPDRQKIGKPAELGLGFGGWIGAWRQFDKSDNFTDEQAKQNIIAWRDASPAIVEMWGGQVRGKSWRPDNYELHGLEGAAISAIQNPGECFEYRGLSLGVKDDVLYGRLPSGRFLTWHTPRLVPSTRWDGQVSITFMGWNTNPKKGPFGWILMYTYGGDIAQSFIQATARDIMAFAVPNLERANYPHVLRVHDEIVSEVPEGFGTIEEFERIMATMPPWAKGWPVRVAGGWRGKRYRKD